MMRSWSPWFASRVSGKRRAGIVNIPPMDAETIKRMLSVMSGQRERIARVLPDETHGDMA